MNIIRLTSKDIKQLKKYELHDSIENTESILYLYRKRELLKIFKSTDEDYRLNKNYILNRLFYLKEHINMPELIMPKELVKVSGKNTGFTMEFIKENTNLSLVFNSSKISIEDKLFFLKEIGKIIEKIEANEILRANSFQLGDIHEGNFIFDNKNNMVKAVDLDSSYVDGMNAPNSKFLTFNDKLWDFPNKYPLSSNDRHIPNYNTTILSYIYMLLNMITEEYVPNMSISNFCSHLNMLNDVGFNKELLDSIFAIYLPKENYFDLTLFDTINPKLILKYREIKNAKK